MVVVNFSLSSFLRAAGYLPMFITLLKQAFGDVRQNLCRTSLSSAFSLFTQLLLVNNQLKINTFAGSYGGSRLKVFYLEVPKN
ncbi:hypothetical protein A4S05_21895 [Nostoc sp. KVJ20]|nr:hypothetical protein A4S05_21895 [Nostoc sp. KVJ20]